MTAYQKSSELKQQDWLNANRAKADSTRELAQVLGLLEPNGLPHTDDTILEKWQTRLYLLKYRIKNARKKNATKKPATGTPSKIGKPAPPKSKTKRPRQNRTS